MYPLVASVALHLGLVNFTGAGTYTTGVLNGARVGFHISRKDQEGEEPRVGGVAVNILDQALPNIEGGFQGVGGGESKAYLGEREKGLFAFLWLDES